MLIEAWSIEWIVWNSHEKYFWVPFEYARVSDNSWKYFTLRMERHFHVYPNLVSWMWCLTLHNSRFLGKTAAPPEMLIDSEIPREEEFKERSVPAISKLDLQCPSQFSFKNSLTPNAFHNHRISFIVSRQISQQKTKFNIV